LLPEKPTTIRGNKKGEEMIETLLGIAILPLICLGVMILTAVVVIFALKRGTQSVSQQVQENMTVSGNSSPTNTRWARGDLKGEPHLEKSKEPMKTCPACGGDNAASSRSCAYCGTVL
jgi:uncharacterized membrane protein